MISPGNNNNKTIEPDSQRSGLTKIYIFTSESFPYGLAATNRIITYARGFLKHKVPVEIICFRKTENKESAVNYQFRGIYKEIPFRYLSKSTIKSRLFPKRQADNLVMDIRLLFFSIALLNNKSLSIYYSSNIKAAIILRFASWLKRSKLFKEESEHPTVYLKFRSLFFVHHYSKFYYGMFDGLLLMTNHLIKFFKEEIQLNKPILHVPMTVDIERFNIQNITRKKRIAYCGVLNNEKDGTDILIRAFAEIHKLYPEYSLSLYGTPVKKEDLKKYYQIVSELNISDHIYFHGKVSNDMIPSLLTEASILVLPRPQSIQAEHGFPTKLGEYLATGNPVIVTPVGDIPEYLKDNENAYFIEPGNINSLVKKCVELIEDKTKSKKIGENGRTVAMKYFNNINQTKQIILFYKRLSLE